MPPFDFYCLETKTVTYCTVRFEPQMMYFFFQLSILISITHTIQQDTTIRKAYSQYYMEVKL